MSDPAVRVTELRFAYPGEPPTLDGVSFDIDPGERVALIGPNGAGKTTLLGCLAGLLAVPPGMIRVHGLDPGNKTDRKRLPAVLGVTFQDADEQLILPTVGEDVAFGPHNLGLPADEVNQRVADAIRAMGLTGRERRAIPTLSAGEKRRTAIAGAIAAGPQTLLLDEPTSGLDPRGRRELAALLNSSESTLLVASHDFAFVSELCGRGLLLGRGKIAADRPLAALLTDAAILGEHGL
jgi:cobalt/nickel transport system ATP-binding protein